MFLADEDPSAMLKVGMPIALLEPYMRHARDDAANGALMLRCDNPQAVVLFFDEVGCQAAQLGERRGPLSPQTAERSIDRGNAAMPKRPIEAVQHCTRALSSANLPTASAVRALGNCAAAHLALDDAAGALADAEAVLLREPTHLKALYRRADLLIRLARHTDAGRAAVALVRESQE
jgi:hypothetical protein